MRILILLLFITFPLYSQIDSIQNLRIKELKQDAKKSNHKVYIKTQFNKNKDLFIFLINESTDTLKIRTESRDNYFIDFKKEVMDTSNSWKTEILNLYCIVGDSHHTMKIPPNYYTWEKIEKFKYFGNYKTKMKVSYNINSKNTLSKEFEISYNADLFLSKDEQYLKFINNQLEVNSNLSKEKRLSLLSKKSESYIKINEFKKAYVLCDSLEKIKFTNDRIRLSKSKSLFKYIGRNLNQITELEKIALVSKNKTLFKEIKSNNKGIKRQINSYLKSLNSVLLSKKEFNEKFSDMNENYFVEINFVELEKVRILFKE